MPIPVVCPGCHSRFTVSDQFAGRTGPCPKCRQSIAIPAGTAKVVTIHEPEPVAAAAAGPGRAPTAPLRRVERPVSPTVIAVSAAAAVVVLAAAWLVGLAWRPGQPPAWLLLAGAFLVALPSVWIGYSAVRERELDPYRGRSLALRCLVCAAAYTALWGVRGLLPADMTADMWQWVFLGPLFFLPGALAALATLELDWTPAAAHFSFYVLFTALLRWIAGLPPV
jgi:hypothetical protein